MNRSSSEATLRGPLVAGLALGLLAGGLFLGLMFIVGCSENLHPGTDRKRVCDSLQESGGFGWWLAVLFPALVLAASQIAPWFRRHVILTATTIILVAIAGWTYALLVVSGNIGS